MVTFLQLLLILSKQYTVHQWKMLHEQNIYIIIIMMIN